MKFQFFFRPNLQRFSITDQSSADERNVSQDVTTYNYNDTQTLRADQKLNYPPPPKMEPDGMLTNGGDHHHHNLHQYAEKQQPQFRQLHLDYDMNSKENNSQNKAEPQQASRIPTGHMRRDRASLRAKQRKDMEQARMQVRIKWFKSKLNF